MLLGEHMNEEIWVPVSTSVHCPFWFGKVNSLPVVYAQFASINAVTHEFAPASTFIWNSVDGIVAQVHRRMYSL